MVGAGELVHGRRRSYGRALSTDATGGLGNGLEWIWKEFEKGDVGEAATQATVEHGCNTRHSSTPLGDRSDETVDTVSRCEHRVHDRDAFFAYGVTDVETLLRKISEHRAYTQSLGDCGLKMESRCMRKESLRHPSAQDQIDTDALIDHGACKSISGGAHDGGVAGKGLSVEERLCTSRLRNERVTFADDPFSFEEFTKFVIEHGTSFRAEDLIAIGEERQEKTDYSVSKTLPSGEALDASPCRSSALCQECVDDEEKRKDLLCNEPWKSLDPHQVCA